MTSAEHIAAAERAAERATGRGLMPDGVAAFAALATAHATIALAMRTSDRYERRPAPEWQPPPGSMSDPHRRGSARRFDTA